MSWNRSDQSSTSINFTESGLYESRYDKRPDGTGLSTDYDDAGQVKSAWSMGKDGKSVKVDGPQ